MTTRQVNMSKIQLFYLAVTRKPGVKANFSPFSIEEKGIYVNPKQISNFSKEFGSVDDIPSFAFIAAFPTLTQCLIRSTIPSKLMGLIHISSEFICHHKPNWLLPSDIRVKITNFSESDKGLLYHIETHIFQQGRLTVTNYNVMLDKNKHYKVKRNTTPQRRPEDIGKTLDSMAIDEKTSRKYAVLSRDFNPIHLHSWLAKKFGLPSALIHGMFNAHYVLSKLPNADILAAEKIKISFNRPCFLPNQVYIRAIVEKSEYGLFSIDNTERYIKVELESS